jgi:hypothetical protein
MHLERYQKAVQQAQEEIAFWTKKTDQPIPIDKLSKIIKQLDLLEKHPLPLSEVHSVEALYKDALSLVDIALANPAKTSDVHIQKLKKKKSEISPITDLSQEKLGEIKNPVIKAIACLKILNEIPPSEKAQATHIASQIPVPPLKKQIIKAIQTTDLDLPLLIFQAKTLSKGKDLSAKDPFCLIIQKVGLLLKAPPLNKPRSYMPLSKQIYFNPTCSKVGYNTKKFLKQSRKDAKPNTVREFTPISHYRLQANPSSILESCLVSKGTILKKFLQKENISPSLLPLLMKHCSLQKLPYHIKTVEKLLLEFHKSEKQDDLMIHALLTMPAITSLLPLEDPEKSRSIIQRHLKS